jgi:hypothetical protein
VRSWRAWWGSDGVVDLAEPVDFDGEGVAVLDGSAVEVLVLKRGSLVPAT